MKSTGYKFDYTSNTLTITAAFAKKASQIGTQEYEIMKTFRRDYPDMKVMKQTAANRGATNPAIKFADMEYYISLFPQEKKVCLERMYNTVRAMSKTHSSPYQYVRDWFLDYFPYYNADPTFDENGNQTNLLTKNEVEMKKTEEELVAAVAAARSTEETAQDA